MVVSIIFTLLSTETPSAADNIKVTLAIPDSMSSQINSGTLTGLMMSLKWKTILSEPR